MSEVQTAEYEVGKQWWFPELGRKPDAGEIVTLPVEVAERYMSNEPGLLKATRRTAQAWPSEVRSKVSEKPKTKRKHRA